MSHIAINSSGEVVLATEVKDDFLRTGKLQEPFRCTFCDVGVRPCAFTRKDFAKEAYFAVDDTPHLSGCPYGAGSNWAGSKRYATRTLFGVTLFLPNELLARKTQPLLVPPGGPTVRGGAPIDVTTRTRNYGHLLQASSHAATSVLARVVEAWKEARSVCYQEAAKRKEKDEHRFVGDKLRQR